MKKSIRLLTALIVVLLMISLMIVSVGAESITDQNNNLAIEKKNILESQIESYSAKDTSEGKVWLSSTGSVISEYTNKLDGYRWDSQNLQTNAIHLTAAQGQAAGRLAWIYYSHDMKDAQTQAVYEAQKAIIDGKEFGELASFFEGENPGVHVCYTTLLAEIYKVKYEAVKEDTDSIAVTQIIDAAINDLTNNNSPQHLTYSDEDATNYKERYQTTLTRVTRQRNRDNASDQLQSIFDLLYPDNNENFANPTNSHLISFYGNLADKNEISEINALFLGTVKGLLDDQKDGRTNFDDFIDKMKTDSENTVGSANTAGKIAELRALFDTYTVESGRAKLRDDWYGEYTKALESIASFVGDDDVLERLASEVHFLVDEQLKRAEKGTWDSVYADGQARLAGVVADAEAQAYTTKHGAILNRSLNDVATADIPALESAMTDATALSDLAAAKLADKLEKLGESYKIAIQKKIQGTAKEDACKDLRNQWINQVNQKVEALPVTDLEALKEQTGNYVDKANTISEILDRYAEIRSAEGYQNYKNHFHSAMEKIATDAASDALQAIATEEMTLAQSLKKIKDDAILDLDRQEGIAKLYASAKDSTLPEITKILTDTQNLINAELNRDAIPSLVSRAVKDIEACLAEEEMKNRTQALKAEIDALPYLSQAEKDTYRAQADAAYEAGVKGLSTGTAANALSGFNAAYNTCRNTVIERNQILGLEHTQKEGIDRLNKAYAELLSNKEFYSQASLEELRAMYNQVYGQVGGYTDRTDLDRLNALIDEKILAMKQIPYNRLYTEDKLLADSSYDLLHPTGYDPQKGGYIGSVEASTGLPSNADLKIQAVDSPDVIKLIREAAKQGRVRLFDGSGASEDLLSRLRTCRLGAALDITLGDVAMPSNNVYAVSVLLAEDVKVSDIIGVVYVCDDGSVEYYEITSEASLIRFTTTHFSNYYVVTDKVVNLLPVIIVLAVLMVCEVLVLIFLYWRRAQEKHAPRETLASVAMPLFLLTKYTPTGGFWIIGALSVGVLALGGWIAYVILADRKEEEIEDEPELVEETVEPEEWVDPVEDEPEILEEALDEEVEEEPEEEPVEEPQEVYASLCAAEEPMALQGAEETAALPEAEEHAALCASEEPAALSSAEELAALSSAEEAVALNAAEERAALQAAEERAVLTGREEVPALGEPVITDAEEEGVIYEGSFTDTDEDWIREMVNEMPDVEEEIPEAEEEEIPEVEEEEIPEAEEEEIPEAEEEAIPEVEEEEILEVEEEAIPEVEEEETPEVEEEVSEIDVEDPLVAEEEPIEEIPEEEPVAEELPEEAAEEPVEETTDEVDTNDPDSLLGALKGMFGMEETSAQESDRAPWEEDEHVAVRADEVDALMTDAEVKEYQKTATVPTTRSTGTKKAQVNLDTISATFSEGDTVTLSALKEKKLVGKNVGAVKILARGTLNKSLIIIAQDFSMAAIKMILLTGGQAIVTKTSGEQKEHRA